MKLAKTIFAIFVIMSCAVGCATKKSAKDYVLANPNNVYRFSENTVLKVMVQDKDSGEWKEGSKKVMIPIGYYIGSGIE